jgi:phosphatidylserine/phosphatidylglycerophosphate/cardiolipin synthase-like enzyme
MDAPLDVLSEVPAAQADPTLSDVEARYLATGQGAATIQTANTEVLPIRDGIPYYRSVYDAIAQTAGAGDTIYLLGWRFDANVDLLNRTLTDPAYKPIGLLLAEKAAAGVDVRMIFSAHASRAAGRVPFSDQPMPFGELLANVRQVRGLTVGGQQPLANRVLLDWSGAISGSHHQKALIVRSSNDLVGFVAGLDIWPNRFDQPTHDQLAPGPLGRWGWHDIGVRLRGGATIELWNNFRSRWVEAASLPRRDYGIAQPSLPLVPSPPPEFQPFNPSIVQPDTPPAPTPISLTTGQVVQVMRSRFPFKIDDVTTGGTRWGQAPTEGIHEIVATYRKAIGAATRYIYIEDQYLADSLVGRRVPDEFSLFPDLQAAAERGVKVIFVGSSLTDPDEFLGAGRLNQSLEDAGDIQAEILDLIQDRSRWLNVAVWRVEQLFIHAKIIIIDDYFAAIGSANMHSRSMYGVDSELQVAFVDVNDKVRQFRMDLWAEHLRLGPGQRPATVDAALSSLDTALAIWRSEWLDNAGDIWRTSGNPAGFAPTESVLTFVGPTGA